MISFMTRSTLRGFLLIITTLSLSLFVCPDKALAQTYDFDAGMKVLTSGIISKKETVLKNKRMAVFGIVEGRSGEQWVITTYIEDEIVDHLVNEGFRVVERRRIEDVIQKEIKKGTDLYFDEAQVAEFGKLLGAEAVVTGSYNRWGENILRINVRCINVSDGNILAANRVNVHTDRIEDLLKKAETKTDKPAPEAPKKPASEPAPAPQSAPQPTPAAPPPAPQPTTPFPQPAPYPQTPQYGNYCCDVFGVKRCQLWQPGPVGGPCFCVGLGTGFICQ